MKKIITFLLFPMMICSCIWFTEEEPYNIEFLSSFETETRPFALAVDPQSGALFILSSKNALNNYFIIGKYSANGEYLDTLIDFETFSNGEFPSYSPANLIIDAKKLIVVTRPETISDQKVFSVLQFNLNGEFQDEFPFYIKEDEGLWGAYAYAKETIYKAGPGFVKTYPLNGEEGAEYRFLDEEEVRKDPFRFHISSLAVNSNEKIYLTGQMPYGLDTVNWGISHHLSIFNTRNSEMTTTELSAHDVCIPGSMISQPQVIIGEQDRVYLTTFYCQQLLVYEKSGEQLAEVFLGDFSDTYLFPGDIAVGNKRIYISETHERMILIFEEK